MRISDDRYSRDRQRIDVALRLIRLEARTHTIRVWTGLTDDRIRKLYRSYPAGPAERRPLRHRGKSPQQAAFFVRTARTRIESGVLASLCQLLGLWAGQDAAAARHLPSLGRAELLCQAYECYRDMAAPPAISFEHAVFLVMTLARREELTLSACRDCGALLVVDRWALRDAQCAPCEAEAAAAGRSQAVATPP